jgi:hypothetical protein
MPLSYLIALQEVTSALVQLQREESAAAATASGGSTEQQQEAVSGAAAAVVSPAEQRVRDLVDKACYLVRTSQTLNPSEYLLSALGCLVGFVALFPAPVAWCVVGGGV